ncbi:hypothetical protein [Streptomyces sp. NPDC047028]|uniref:hypothetical protein n=1 Tax=Streptomyces sp. NPDC047028 TaxID=3155793 RepID=UPI00340A6DDB
MTTQSPTEQAIAVMEEFRTGVREIGKSSAVIEAFIDQMNALIVQYRDPKTAMDVLFAALAEMRPDDPAVINAIGSKA